VEVAGCGRNGLKKGALWRRRQVEALPPEDLDAFLKGCGRPFQCTSAMARKVYKALPESSGLRTLAITAIDAGYRAFLWRELELHKGTPFGDWVVIAMCRGSFELGEDERLLALFRDRSAHEMVRASVLYALNNYVEHFPPSEGVRSACREGLGHPTAYGRIGAIWLAKTLGGFEREIEVLLEEESMSEDGTATVASEAQFALEVGPV
jgi:hypothetical protein